MKRKKRIVASTKSKRQITVMLDHELHDVMFENELRTGAPLSLQIRAAVLSYLATDACQSPKWIKAMVKIGRGEATCASFIKSDV